MYIIQFIHPINEASRGSKLTTPIQGYSYHCPWLVQSATGKVNHHRKFLLNEGDYINGKNKVVHDNNLRLWAEAEWDTLSRPTNAVVKGNPPMPKNEHNIHLPIPAPSRLIPGTSANTDPYVFGRQFKYTNCRQGSFPVLQNLPAGSIILFGSHRKDGKGGYVFLLDTVFVVSETSWQLNFDKGGKVIAPSSCLAHPEITNLFQKRVLKPLLGNQGGGCAPGTLCSRLYLGETYQGQGKPFSYVPVIPGSTAFPRMELRSLALPNWKPGTDCIKPGCQSIHYIKVSSNEIKQLWTQLLSQVRSNGYAPAWNFTE